MAARARFGVRGPHGVVQEHLLFGESGPRARSRPGVLLPGRPGMTAYLRAVR